MTKRVLVLLSMILLLSFTGQSFAADAFLINSDGKILSIDSSNYGENMRVLVEKDASQYFYILNNKVEVLPLQLGEGDYSIKILENIEGNRYRVVSKKTIFVPEFNQNESFLVSAQPVYWREGQATKLAMDLTREDVKTKQKVNSIYNYIIKNIAYDYNKAAALTDDYVPNIEETLNIKSGICYDYAALMAGMLRSLGIPTKLVKGYKNDLEIYHAWNEVLIEDKWVIIDTTYDAAFVKANIATSMIKPNSEYNKVREY
ncbi:transglutaminase-like domain-containing protein [Tissierellaceae bacterium HCP3S3_D8]